MGETESRTLWKCANRRLYDPRSSQFVRLEHLRQFLIAGSDVEVLQRRSGEDITCTVLTQLALELEESGNAAQALFSRELLTELIYCQQQVGTENVSHYLDECLRLFFAGVANTD